MNKRILFGVLFLALGATCGRSLKATPKEAKIPSLGHSSQGATLGSKLGFSRHDLDDASKGLSRIPTGRENVSPRSSRDLPTRAEIHAAEPNPNKAALVEASVDVAKAVQNLTKTLAEKKSPEEKAKMTPAELSNYRALRDTTRTPEEIQQRKQKEALKAFENAIKDLKLPPTSPATIATTEERKPTHEKIERESQERTRTQRIAEEKIAITIPAPPPLPTDLTDKKGKFGMYAPTEAELVEKKGQLKPTPSISPAPTPLPITAIAPADESKPGMSGKKKAAIGAAATVGAVGAVGAGAVGVGAAALGAGLIGAAGIGIGAAMSGDKDKPAPEVAPERVEDIKGLDAGSGLGQSFEASSFDS